MDLPTFDTAQIEVRQAKPGTRTTENVVDVILRGLARNWKEGGLPKVFGLPVTPPPVHHFDGTTTPYSARRWKNSAGVMRRQLQIDPTRIPGIEP